MPLSRSIALLGLGLLLVARGPVYAADRPAQILDVLPPYFAFGTSWFSATRDWQVDRFEKDGIRWGLQYTYVFPDTSRRKGTTSEYLGWFWDRCRRTRSIPIMSMYGLLDLGTDQGITGNEIEVVIAACKNRDVMRQYLLENIRLLKLCAQYDGPCIFHSEPDSWAFLEWHGSNDTHDADQVPVMVGSTGIPEVKDFRDTAGGLGKALIHLRDLYAPNTYMGFHAKDCRVGTQPEATVTFIRGCGTWDILIGDGIGHVYESRDAGWWKTFSEERFARYLTWYGTLTRELGLPYIHWQSVVGKADVTVLQNFPEDHRLEAYRKAGAVAILFDLRGDPNTVSRASDANHGYTDSPPAGDPNEASVPALVRRLSAYYRNPLPQVWIKSRSETSAKAAKPMVVRQAKSPLPGLPDDLRAEVLDRLRILTVRAIEAQRPPHCQLAALDATATIEGLDGTMISFRFDDGRTMMMPLWNLLTKPDRTTLAMSLVSFDPEEGHALVGACAIDQGDRNLATMHLRDAGTAGEAFLTLLDQP